MPFRAIQLRPGVNLEQSQTLNETQLFASNLIRFYGGMAQKIGGWLQLCATALIGTCRGLHGWSDIVGAPYLAAGTEQRLEVLIGGALNDITPIVQTDNPPVSFTTTLGSPVVQITDAGYTPNVGDWIYLATYVSIDTIILFGYYQVTASISGTVFAVTAASNGAAGVSAGGVVPQYTTINTQSVVTVTLPNHGFVTGSIYNAVVSTTVATIVISGSYSVTFVDANNFTIPTSGVANASTSAFENSGNARIEYLLPTGLAVDTPLVGYGTGLYGTGLYGVGGGGSSISALRQWSLDNFGQDLIASPSNGRIYFWQPPTVAPATVVSVTAPLESTAVFVMSQAEIIVAIGAEVSGTQEPLLVRWCDAADFTDWNATATNQAGSYSIPNGSKLVGGLAVGLGALLWTDEALWTMTYLNFPLVFGFNQLAAGCGLTAQRAIGTNGQLTMWLGGSNTAPSGFFQVQSGSGVIPMECPVWDFLINNIDTLQLPQVHCAVNTLFNEMAWHFPLLTSSPLWNALTPLGYVKYNYVEKCWDYGLSSQYQRTAWTGVSPVGNPVGTDLSGLIQQHEITYDANGTAMQWSWQTGYFDLMEGEEFFFSDLIIPDFVTVGVPSWTPTVLATDYPQATPTSALVPGITGMSNWITYSVRGRQMALGISGNDLGTFSRLGKFRIRYSPDGRN